MKKMTLISVVFFVTFTLFSTKMIAQPGSNSSQLLHHVLIVTFKKEASPDSIKVVDVALTKFSKIPVVKGYEWGTDVSPTKGNQEEHFYVISFSKQDDIEVFTKSLLSEPCLPPRLPLVSLNKIYCCPEFVTQDKLTILIHSRVSLPGNKESRTRRHF